MKKFLLGLLAIIGFLNSTYGQTNNPFNGWGSNIVSAALVINQDYLNGKLKEISQEKLNDYFKTFFPEEKSIELDEFLKIVDLMKNANSESIIKQSGYSELGMDFLRKTLTDESVTAQVDQVLKSKLPENEKQGILSVLAVNYNLIKPLKEIHQEGSISTKGPAPYLIETFPLELNQKPFSALILGGIGYVIGSAIFTSTAAIVTTTVVGIVAGGILGEIRNPKTPPTTWHGGTNNSGGFNPPQP